MRDGVRVVRVSVPVGHAPILPCHDGAVSDAALPARHLLREGPGRPEAPVATLSVRTRLRGTIATDRFWGWLGPLLVTAVGGFLRFWHLDRPHELVFDETYYVKQGYSFLKVGYELAWRQDVKPDQLFTKGNLNVFQSGPDFVVHPPVGKWMIAAGEELFGPTSSWGWRFSAALVGTLSLLMIGRIARRLFGSTLLGTTAALLLAVDGQHFVLSRTAILDIFVMFWALAGFGCLVIDRDHARERLARRVEAGSDLTGFGPWLGVRPWRLAGAVCLGLSAGVKWSGAFFLAVFLLMSFLWDVAARRGAGVDRWLLGGVVKDGLPAAALTLPLALATYLASWTGWFRSKDAWDRQWGAQHPSSTWGWIPDALRGLWHYHSEMWTFNVNLHSPHTYQSNPWSWIVTSRPTAFYYQGSKSGEHGCTSSPARERSRRSETPWCGGAGRSPSPSCSCAGSSAGTGGQGRSSPGWPPAGCPGSTTRTARSTASTRWPSCRGSCSPSPTASVCCSGRARLPLTGASTAASRPAPSSRSPW